jgi:uncharacterized protein (TIRG00374 family)
MSEKSFLKRRWKLILNILTVAALVVLAIAIRHQLVDTFKNLARVHVWALLLLIPLEFLNYDAQARLYRCLFATAGNKLSYKAMFKTSLELNFINNVFPSGGVSGISYFGMRMRRDDITGGRATLVQLMKLVLTFLSFEVILIFGMILLAAVGKVNNLVILVGASMTTFLVLGTFGFTYIISSKTRITGFLTFFTRVINKIIHVVRPRYPETINLKRASSAFAELHENYMLFHKKYRELQAPFWWSLVMNLAEVLCVYVVYIAFGEWVNLGAVILAYAVANFAGLVSVLPGGVGVYEALMTGVLVVAGVPAALSIPVVVMYRVLNTLIQLPPGYVLYHRSLHSDKSDA